MAPKPSASTITDVLPSRSAENSAAAIPPSNVSQANICPALLIACPLAEGTSKIDISLLNEADYVQITLDWLESQKIRYENHNWKRFVVPGGQSYTAFDRSIPADFSSATFFLCAAAMLADEVLIEGLDFTDSQPDKAVIDYLKAMGADIVQ